jgi:hypothetical protein
MVGMGWFGLVGLILSGRGEEQRRAGMTVWMDARDVLRLWERVGELANRGKMGAGGVVGVSIGELCSCILLETFPNTFDDAFSDSQALDMLVCSRVCRS